MSCNKVLYIVKVYATQVTHVLSTILSHSIHLNNASVEKSPDSFSFLLSLISPLAFGHDSLHQRSTPISLYAVAFDPSIYVCPSIWISNLQILSMLFDDPGSLCHRRGWDLEIGQPEYRGSIFLPCANPFSLSFFLSFSLFFPRKKRKIKKRRDPVTFNWKTALFHETRVLDSRPPLMD